MCQYDDTVRTFACRGPLIDVAQPLVPCPAPRLRLVEVIHDQRVCTKAVGCLIEVHADVAVRRERAWDGSHADGAAHCCWCIKNCSFLGQNSIGDG